MELYQELLTLTRIVSRFDRYLFKQYHISSAEHLVLMSLFSKRVATSSQLSDTLIISKSAIRIHVKVLLAKGYINKLSYNPNDQRSFNLTLTESGNKILKEINSSIQQINNQLFEKESPRQMRQLIRDLRTFNFSLAIVEDDLIQ